MNFLRQIENRKFSQVMWLFPLAYALHVVEEFPRFTTWAQHYAAQAYSMREYVIIHATGLVVALAAPVILRLSANRIIVLLFLTLVFTPAVCFNVLFHVGATAYFGVYCPGVITALFIYVPLFLVVIRLVLREGLLTKRSAIISLVLAGLIHLADVSHNVFKAW